MTSTETTKLHGLTVKFYGGSEAHASTNEYLTGLLNKYGNQVHLQHAAWIP